MSPEFDQQVEPVIEREGALNTNEGPVLDTVESIIARNEVLIRYSKRISRGYDIIQKQARRLSREHKINFFSEPQVAELGIIDNSAANFYRHH